MVVFRAGLVFLTSTYRNGKDINLNRPIKLQQYYITNNNTPLDFVFKITAHIVVDIANINKNNIVCAAVYISHERVNISNC